FKFKDFTVPVFYCCGLGIGRFLGTFPGINTIYASCGIHGNRVFIFVQSPSRHVKLVGALVAGIAVSGIPMPVPVVMTPFFVVRTVRSRTEPFVVVQGRRWRTVLGNSEGIPG